MTQQNKRFFFDQFPAFVWAGVIFYVSSIPGDKLPHIVHYFNDKFLHTVFFCIFGILIYRFLNSFQSPDIFRWKNIVIEILIVSMYGVSDEFHQSFVPGRTVDVKDATADAFGGLLAALVIYFYFRWKTRSE